MCKQLEKPSDEGLVISLIRLTEYPIFYELFNSFAKVTGQDVSVFNEEDGYDEKICRSVPVVVWVYKPRVLKIENNFYQKM